jgi:hypothetical protein
MSFVNKLGSGLMSGTWGDIKRDRGDQYTNVNVPGRTPEEEALLKEQTALLQQQRQQLTQQLAQQDLLFGQLGFSKDASGAWQRTGPQAEIDSLMQERTLKALKGELPVDAKFEQDRAAARQTLGEVMQRNLGQGWETSTPGSEALVDFDAETDALRAQIREGVLTNNEALINQRSNRTFGQVVSPQLTAASATLSGAYATGPLQNFMQRADLGFRGSSANVTNATNRYDAALRHRGTLFSAVFA